MKILLRLFTRYHLRQVPMLFMGAACLSALLHFLFSRQGDLGAFAPFLFLVFLPMGIAMKHWQFLQGNLNWILTLPIRKSALLIVSASALFIAELILFPTAILGMIAGKYTLAIFENWLYSKPFTWLAGPIATWFEFEQRNQAHPGGALGTIWKELTGETLYATSFAQLSQAIFVGLAICLSIPPNRAETLRRLFNAQNFQGLRLTRDTVFKYSLNIAVVAFGFWTLITSKLIFAFALGFFLVCGILYGTLDRLHLHFKWKAVYLGVFAVIMLAGDFVLYQRVVEQAKSPAPIAMRDALSWLGNLSHKQERATLVRGLLAAQDKRELRRAWREIGRLTSSTLLTNQASEGVVYMDGVKRWNDPETLAAWIALFTPASLKIDEIKATLTRVDTGLNPRTLTNPTIYGLLAVPLVPVEVDEFLKSPHPRFFAFGVYKARFQRDKDYIPQIRKNLAQISGRFPSLQVDLFQISRMTLSILSGRNVSYDQVLPVLKFMRSPASEGITLDCTKLKAPREWKSLNTDQLTRYNVCLRERTARKDPSRIDTVLSEGWYVSPLAASEIQLLEFAFN